jgi:hypothetical protein
MLSIDGFVYSLAIMLMNAKELFRGDWECLTTLSVTVDGGNCCDFSNVEEMKGKGMGIMKSIRDYNLAYVYLGDDSE